MALTLPYSMNWIISLTHLKKKLTGEEYKDNLVKEHFQFPQSHFDKLAKLSYRGDN
jgi:hypothetical protein